MLSKAQVDRIAVVLGLTPSQVKEEIEKTEESTAAIPDDLVVIKQSDLDAQKENYLKEKKKDLLKENETQVKQIVAKKIKDELGIQDEGKDLDQVITKAKELKMGEGEAQERAKLLQQTLAQKEQELQAEKAKAAAAAFDADLIASLPKSKSGLSAKEELILLKNALEFSEDGVKKEGTLLRHQANANPLTKKEAIEAFYKEKGWYDDGSGSEGGMGGGRGGGNQHGSTKFKTIKEVRIDWEAKNPGKSWMSEEAQEFALDYVGKNPDVVMDDDGKG